MKTLALIGKGGTSKTTTAVNIAVAAVQDGLRVAIVDLDSGGEDGQSSLVEWWQKREAEQPVLVETTPKALAGDVAQLRDMGFDLAIVDTPANTKPSRVVVEKGASVADFVVITCQASSLDMRANRLAVDIVQRLGKQAAFLMTRTARTMATRANDAREGLAEYDLPILPVNTRNLVPYQDADTLGMGVLEFEPKGQAATETAALWAHIRATLSL